MNDDDFKPTIDDTGISISADTEHDTLQKIFEATFTT